MGAVRLDWVGIIPPLFVRRRINHCFVGTYVTAIELEWNRLMCNLIQTFQPKMNHL